MYRVPQTDVFVEKPLGLLYYKTNIWRVARSPEHRPHIFLKISFTTGFLLYLKKKDRVSALYLSSSFSFLLVKKRSRIVVHQEASNTGRTVIYSDCCERHFTAYTPFVLTITKFSA
jgi:hypothetical protein